MRTDFSATPRHLLDLALIIGLGLLFPLLHTVNNWLFHFAEVSPNIGLIYLPAFLRLLNVLLLGKLKGTLAGLLGGLTLVLLSPQPPEIMDWMNILCSAASPVVAVLLFEHWRKRSVKLVSLQDLGQVTLIYCLANALIHHLAWTWVAPGALRSPDQVLWMVIGDLLGALIGAYLFKWGAARFGPLPPAP